MLETLLSQIRLIHEAAHKDLELWADNRKSDGTQWVTYSDLCDAVSKSILANTNYRITLVDGEVIDTKGDTVWKSNTDCLRGVDSNNYFFGHAIWRIESIVTLEALKC